MLIKMDATISEFFRIFTFSTPRGGGGVILDCVRWTSDLQWVKFWIKFESLFQTNHITASPSYCLWIRNQPCTFVFPLSGTSLKTSWPHSHHRWATSWTWSIALVLNIHIVPHVIVLFIRGTPSHGYGHAWHSESWLCGATFLLHSMG